MKKKNKIIPFRNKLFTLIGGTLGTYLFPVIFSPILTRIYSPEEFSIYTIYITIVQIISIVAGLRYEFGIPIAKDRYERVNLFRISVINSVIVSGLTFLFFSLLPLFIIDKNYYQISIMRYSVPLGVLLMSLFHHILYNWLLYKKSFKCISISKIIFGLLYAILPILLFDFFHFKNYKYLIFSHQVALVASLFFIVVFLQQ